MSRAIFNGVDRYRKSYIAYHTKGQFFSFFMKNKTITDLWCFWKEITGVFKIPHLPTNIG